MSLLDRIFKRKPGAGSAVESTPADDVLKSPKKSALAKAFERFSRKPKSDLIGKLSSIDAIKAVVIAPEENAAGGNASLAFGLRWRRILTTTTGKDAGSVMAKKNGATHFILRGYLVGYTILPKNQSANVNAASVSAAKVFGGTGIFALTLGHGQYWIGVVRNNEPVNTDDVFEDVEVSQIIDRVRHLQQEFKDDAVQVFTDIEQSGLVGARAFSARDLFDVPRPDKEQILPVASGKSSIPKPVMITAIVGVGLLAAQRGYVEYDNYKKRALASSLVPVDETPEEAWAPVFAKFAKQTIQPEKASFLAARASINQIPVHFNGWLLESIRCNTPDIQQQAEPVGTWSCTATYAITRVSATSEQMLAIAKREYPKFKMAFPKLSSIEMSWTATYTTNPVDLKVLPQSAPERLRIISILQRLAPALGSAPEFQFKPFPFDAPKKKDGSPQPMPSNAPAIMEGAMVIKAPLRSIDVLMEDMPMTLDSFSVAVTANSSRDSKTINSSAVTAEISGKRYAVQ